VFENRIHVPVRSRVGREGTTARRLKAGGAVTLGQAHEAETGAVPLLGMRSALEDGGRERGGGRTDRASPQRCPPRTRELLGKLKCLATSPEFEGLFKRICEFLHPADRVDDSSIDREQTFPFRKHRPVRRAA
jgi:hypothetical protein